MTRIKKRRSGKNRTADQKRSAAGKRRARTAEKPDLNKDKEHEPAKATITPEKKAAYKKSFQPVQSSRRNRSTKKEIAEKNTTAGFKVKPGSRNAAVAPKTTGKTRSAGARRIAVAKSVATNFKNKGTHKKVFLPKKEETGEAKSPKGFAPWNKNKFKGKKKGQA